MISAGTVNTETPTREELSSQLRRAIEVATLVLSRSPGPAIAVCIKDIRDRMTATLAALTALPAWVDPEQPLPEEVKSWIALHGSKLLRAMLNEMEQVGRDLESAQTECSRLRARVRELEEAWRVNR